MLKEALCQVSQEWCKIPRVVCITCMQILYKSDSSGNYISMC